MQNPILTEKLSLQTYQGYQWRLVVEEKVEKQPVHPSAKLILHLQKETCAFNSGTLLSALPGSLPCKLKLQKEGGEPCKFITFGYIERMHVKGMLMLPAREGSMMSKWMLAIH